MEAMTSDFWVLPSEIDSKRVSASWKREKDTPGISFSTKRATSALELKVRLPMEKVSEGRRASSNFS